MKEFLKTNRLLLRFFEETDLDDLFRLLSNPKVMTYLEPPFGKEKTKEFLFKYCLNDDPLLYALEYEEKFIGYVIYHTFEEDSMEIGWVLFPEYWSKGFASELTEKLIEVTKKQNKKTIIECDPNQTASIKIAKKFNFSLINEDDELLTFELEANMDNSYKNLVEFWNNCFEMNDEDKKQVFDSINIEEDWKAMAPSPKLFDAVSTFKDKENVLDYGCGSGWASIIMAKSGVKKITAVDVAPNSIEMLNLYKEAFKVSENIDTFVIDEKWLGNQEEKYDGLYCSNVVDVVPYEMAKDIIKNAAKVVKKGAKVIFSLNFYMSPKMMEERGIKSDGRHVYMDGVLRLLSLSDVEWKSLFEQYFKFIKLEYFSWAGEAKEARRLFILEK